MVPPRPDPQYFRALRARLEAEHGREAADRLQPHEVAALQGRGLAIRDAAAIVVRVSRPLADA
jgi:hypothetical protein